MPRRDGKITTPVVELIAIAWKNAGGNPFAWESFNSQVGSIVRIAAAGFEWKEKDLDAILAFANRRYSISKCLGDGGIERLYSIAVQSGNFSFCVEYERWCGRQPIIADNVNGRLRDRLCVGSKFVWNGEPVTVTSFNKDGHAVACSYEVTNTGADCDTCGRCCKSAETKIHRRYSISTDDIKAARKTAKEAAKSE